MVVGFVNSGLMTLRQAINVIMGANVGTTVTAWLLSLGGIESSSVWLRLLKPSSFTPVLALIGIVFYMFCKDAKKKGHRHHSPRLCHAHVRHGDDERRGLPASQVPAFTNLFLAFRNPILGVLVGAVLTGIIQSSSASVGILQALSATGAVSYAAAIPIIMGQNIGTTVTAMLSSVGTNKNARRAAVVHLLFNVIGVAVLLSVFCIVRAVLAPALLDESATRAGIAVAHSVFNLLCTAMLLPAGDLLEKLAIRLVPDSKSAETVSELDERLLAAPSLALSRSRAVACEMAQCAVRALNNALRSFTEYTDTLARSIRDDEERCDHYEDILGTYLVQLSARKMGVDESEEATELLKSIGDFERISDHAVNILESAEELRGKSLAFSAAAAREYDVLAAAIGEILDLPAALRSSGRTSPSPSWSSRSSRSSTRSRSRCARATSCGCSRGIAASRPASSGPICSRTSSAPPTTAPTSPAASSTPRSTISICTKRSARRTAIRTPSAASLSATPPNTPLPAPASAQ